MDPTLPDLFRLMGLKPLDEFINSQIHNRPLSNGQYGIPLGASTWMALAVAQHLKDGHDAYIVSPQSDINLPKRPGRSRHLAQVPDPQAAVLDCCEKMSLGRIAHQPFGFTLSKSWAKFHNGTTLKWKTGAADVVRIIGYTGRIFNDAAWAERTLRRAQGPYAMIQKVEFADGEWTGLAEDDEAVMEFTEHGVREFLHDHPAVFQRSDTGTLTALRRFKANTPSFTPRTK